ncbi:hypothetical protein [Secundilactobacillus muriivasis]
MKIDLIKRKNVPKSYHLGNVIYFYGDDVLAMVAESGDNVALVNLENGETYRSASTLNDLYLQMDADHGELINAELREVRS